MRLVVAQWNLEPGIRHVAQRHAQRPAGEQREPPVRCSVKFAAADLRDVINSGLLYNPVRPL